MNDLLALWIALAFVLSWFGPLIINQRGCLAELVRFVLSFVVNLFIWPVTALMLIWHILH